MPDNYCANHIDRKAVGTCHRCRRFFCAPCLDMDSMDQPACPECMKLKPGEKSPNEAKPGAPPPAIKSASKDPFDDWAGTKPQNAPTPMPPKPQMPAPLPAYTPVPMASRPLTPGPSPSKPPGPAVSPLNFKGKGLDDDPFGLFGAPKPAVQPPPPSKAAPEGDQVLDDKETPPTSPLDRSSLGHAVAPLSVPQTTAPKLTPPDLNFSKAIPAPKIESPRPISPKAAPHLVVDSAGREGKQPTASAQHSEPPEPSLFVPPSYGEVPLTEPLPQTLPNRKGMGHLNLLLLIKQWTRYYFHKLTDVLEPASKKLHIPIGVLAFLVLALLAGLVWGVGALMPSAAVKLVDNIPPIHVVEVTPNQISEMDITSYTEFQNQLQSMGFADLIQFTVPQLPNTNFMDVGMKQDVSTYSEIIKFPGTIVPKVSFVTTFTNGVWFSTNGWAGTNSENAWQVSEFFPNDPVDQLYVKHVQRVQQMLADNGWQAQSMSEQRYVASLSDEIRTFLVDKKVPAYQANFALWH